MGTITLSVNDEVEEEFRNIVKKNRSKKKGSLGKAATEALRLWVRKKKQEEISEEALELMGEGFEMGERLHEERGDLHK
ncbi:hypothetical protein AKJ65_08030 [candidate division MSBL1 archaeon SCGC-AAA259E19]|uniref:XACb0070 ribbon-helix-helix domain-containing protein n=1 Tax=candidate division MSBL1 archaeon SCGC-AAA259E19 TaxID=1698264 RepID=A0A133UD54_9EURY|nr:hypothetical protein AKJ65_08030 [candidate division MSBL1 archaeon SCGC-AAA259E19]